VRPRPALLIGFVLGGLTGAAYLVMPISIYASLVVWAFLLQRSGRLPAVAGGLMGFGLAEEILVGRYALVCATDSTCTQPNFTLVWVGIGLVFFVPGALLALTARSQLRDG
jgi:hypothetical protein